MTTSLDTTGALRTAPSLHRLPTVPRSRALLASILCAAALPACLQAGGDDFGSASSTAEPSLKYTGVNNLPLYVIDADP